MRVRTFAPLLAVALLLAACGAPTPPALPSVSGESYTFDVGQPEALAVGFVMLEASFVATAAPGDLAGASLVEVVEGVWMGNVAPVDAAGGFRVVLPAAADVPAATLEPLDEAVWNFVQDACTVEAAPAGARGSVTLFEGIVVPGLVALTTEGSFLALASDVAFDGGGGLADLDGSYQGWIYVDRDASLAASGCDYTADLTLEEGWNQLAWTIVGPSDIEVAVVAPADVFATPLVRFPPPAMVVFGQP